MFVCYHYKFSLCFSYVIVSGQDESVAEKIRSILAQMEYQYQICEWEQKGVHFHHHIYFPKIHPITNQPFYEMEDEAHVLKVCN